MHSVSNEMENDEDVARKQHIIEYIHEKLNAWIQSVFKELVLGRNEE